MSTAYYFNIFPRNAYYAIEKNAEIKLYDISLSVFF